MLWDRNVDDKICFMVLEAGGQVEPLPKYQSKVGPLWCSNLYSELLLHEYTTYTV